MSASDRLSIGDVDPNRIVTYAEELFYALVAQQECDELLGQLGAAGEADVEALQRVKTAKRVALALRMDVFAKIVRGAA